MAKNKVKKIAIIFHDLDVGGVQKKILSLIENINSNIEITIYLYSNVGFFVDSLPKNIIVKSVNSNEKVGMFRFTLWLLKSILKDNQNHILSFLNTGSIPALICKKIIFWRKIDVYISEDINTSKDIVNEKMFKLRLFLLKKLYPLAKKIIVLSNTQKNDLNELLNIKNPGKIILCPNWLVENKNINNFKKRDIDILFLGRIVKQKNLKRFIEIVNEIKKSNKNIKVVIVGEGNYLIKIKNLVKRNALEKEISFFDFTKEVSSFYLRSKIFLMTSDYEGFPLTLLEAIYYGCFPVVYKVGEVSSFFDKYSEKILFSSHKNAVELITNELEKSREDIINYYKNKVISDKDKNIKGFINAIDL